MPPPPVCSVRTLHLAWAWACSLLPKHRRVGRSRRGQCVLSSLSSSAKLQARQHWGAANEPSAWVQTAGPAKASSARYRALPNALPNANTQSGASSTLLSHAHGWGGHASRRQPHVHGYPKTPSYSKPKAQNKASVCVCVGGGGRMSCPSPSPTNTVTFVWRNQPLQQAACPALPLPLAHSGRTHCGMQHARTRHAGGLNQR